MNLSFAAAQHKNTVAPFFPGLLPVFQNYYFFHWKEKISFLLRGKTVVGVLYQTALWRERERERELCRHLTFLYSLTIGALKVFHLWSSCGKKKNHGASDSLRLPVQYIYISAPIKAGQYAIPMYVLLWAPCLPTIISTDILCANAVIDTFITSKGIQFSFQSSTGMNSAASSAANNEGPLPAKPKETAAFRRRIRGGEIKKSVSNCLLTPTFVLGNRDSFQTG